LLSDKIENLRDGKPHGGKNLGKQGSNQDSNKGKQEIIYDNDKNHANWHVKQGEDFSKVFYKNQ
jgi:hypothetical protein